MYNIKPSSRKFLGLILRTTVKYKCQNDFTDHSTFIREACHTTPVLMLSSAYIYLEGRESSENIPQEQIHSLATSGLRCEVLLAIMILKLIYFQNLFVLTPSNHPIAVHLCIPLSQKQYLIGQLILHLCGFQPKMV